MKGKFATLLGAMTAMVLLAGSAAAHPGHSATDVTAQLATPLAGPDHLAVFVTVGILAVLGTARLALYFIDLRRRARR